MGFTLQLDRDVIEVEAGSNTPVSIKIANRGSTPDRYELEVEGIDTEWKAVPVPVFTVEPEQEQSERVFFRPPRASESVAGVYPFVVSVRSLESGESHTVQGVLKVKPFHSLSMEINPKRGIFSPITKRNTFEVSLVNLGNTEHTIQLSGIDPEDVCAYEFEKEQVSLGPGQQRTVTVTATPSRTPILSSGRLVGFSIVGRSVDVPAVAGTAQAQLEHRSLLSPTALIMLVLVLLVLGALLLVMPKRPGLDLSVDPMKGMVGDQAVISWSAHDANHVHIFTTPPSGPSITLYDGSQLKGTVPLTLEVAGIESITAEASKDSNHGPAVQQTITVNAPPPVSQPTIKSFTVSAEKVREGKNYVYRAKLGTSVTFKWEVNNADTVNIAPVERGIPAADGSASVTPTVDQDYQLIAHSKDGGVAESKKIHVAVYDESEARILAFSADPAVVEQGGTTTVSWQVVKSARVELQVDTSASSVVPAMSSQTSTITTKTMFVLTAVNDNGIKTSRKIWVDVKLPPPPTNPPGDTGNPPTDTTGGNTAGATTGTPPATTGNPGTTGDTAGGTR